MSIVVCMIVQIVINSVTIVQIVVQCGPYPYRPVCMPSYQLEVCSADTDVTGRSDEILPLHVGSSSCGWIRQVSEPFCADHCRICARR